MSVNVFEMAFTQNANLEKKSTDNTKSVTKRIVNKALKESNLTSKSNITDNAKKSIPLNKIGFTEDIDDIDIKPSENVVVVYSDEVKPEMSAEEVEAAAEKLVGATICKCGICGANYIADTSHCHDIENDSIVFDSHNDDDSFDESEIEDTVSESILFTEDGVSDDDADDESENIECDTTCPVCTATTDQVEVGVIAPSESEEDEVNDTDSNSDNESTDDSKNDDDDSNDDSDDDSDDDAEDNNEDDKETQDESKSNLINFKESALNILFNKFVRENYNNIKSVRINEGMSKNGELIFNGVVNTVKGSKRPITLSTVKFNYTEGLMKLRVIENGPFTENMQKDNKRVPFVLECKARNGVIIPIALKYNYNITESNDTYNVFGKVKLKG